MPPFIARKRTRSPSPVAEPPRKRIATAKHTAPAKQKVRGCPPKSVFEAIDISQKKKRTAADNKRLLEEQDEDEESTSGSSDSESDEFEDVIPTTSKSTGYDGVAETEDKDDDTTSQASSDWENILGTENPPAASSSKSSATLPTNGLVIKLKDTDEDLDYSQWAAARELAGKKGPTKIERQIRVATHCMHVQFLLFHNLIRNSWIQDQEVKTILLGKLTDGCWKEITKWRTSMGLPELGKDGTETFKNTDEPSSTSKKGKSKAKGKGKKEDSRKHRDWSQNAVRENQDPITNPNQDPLPRLLAYILSFWKKTFKATAPSLKKIGYLEPRILQKHVKAYQKERTNHERFGETVKNIAEFRECARNASGSQDIGQQLFAGLLRTVGVEARMVCSLQPIGFGWSKAEEGKLKTEHEVEDKAGKDPKENPVAAESDNADAELDVLMEATKTTSSKQKIATKANATKRDKKASTAKPARASKRGSKAAPIDLDSGSSELSSPPSEAESDSDLSIVDLTPMKPTKPRSQYRTHPFPTYWTEAISPLTNLPHAVSPLIAPHIASNAEGFQSFEPRGKDAEKAKQIFAYVIAFSSDGSAKDVTVRYLKRRMWPGKTKGLRMLPEKIPILNRRGKVKRYEQYDWFKTVMSSYQRHPLKRTAADKLEDATDLVPVKPAKKAPEESLDTLGGLKASAEYCLERFLRREEALLPEAKAVRTFTSGKGDKMKSEPVYLRKDVVACKTVESWHKEGREIIAGAQPLKRVPHRAVTLQRKREIEDMARELGEKPLQGLYSKAQTQWIIPPPIENGVIPRNAFGNIDVYVPSMVPRGAIHLPLKGTMRICKKLGINFAEACVGFEFGAQRAVPVIHGVVVAEENGPTVRDAWKVEREQQKIKEDIKREAKALALWKKFMMGMRIIARVKAEYAHDGNANEAGLNPFVNKKQREENGKTMQRQPRDHIDQDHDDVEDLAGGFDKTDEDMAGGFFVPGHEEEEVLRPVVTDAISGNDAGEFLIEDDAADEARSHAPKANGNLETPISLQSASKLANGIEQEDFAAKSATAAKPPESDAASDEKTPRKPEANGSARSRARPRGSRTSMASRKSNPRPQSTYAKKARTSKSKSSAAPVSDEYMSDASAVSPPPDAMDICEDDDEPSAFEEEEEEEKPVKSKKRGRPRKQLPVEKEGARKTPRRQAAARMGAGAGVRSKYFEGSDTNTD